MMKNRKIFVAGHKGLVGSAICRALLAAGEEVLTADRAELDLLNQAKVKQFFELHDIDEVYLCAARVGGIKANIDFGYDFIYENLVIETNIIHAAFKSGTRKLLLLGSSCIYPKMAVQPISEEALLTGALEETNAPYAIAKIAGIKLVESIKIQYDFDYRAVMPTNLYGIGDRFDLKNGHVLPSLMRRFHEAKINGSPQVEIWGSGSPLREFLFADDLASACVYISGISQDRYNSALEPGIAHLNIGSGDEYSIKELAYMIGELVGFEGCIVFDSSMPDGTPRKILDCSRLEELGWKRQTSFVEGLQQTYEWFKQQ